MKKWMAMLFVWLLIIVNGCAAAQTYEIDDGNNGYFICEDFEGDMPEMAQRIFGGLLGEGDWPYTILAEGKAVPNRLCAWTADTLPKTEAGLRAFEQRYPLVLDDDEAYIAGVNLRERATGESASWGIYSAKVKVIGEQPGKTAPWVHVRLGELEGWVSGSYVHSSNRNDGMHITDAAAMVHPVGRAKAETALMHMPGGKAIMQLAADTYVHVLGERNGWLHVIVPRGEIAWQTDWDGTYGFVKADDMAVGISKTDALHEK